jgi:3-dehydroquinate synthetase
LPTDCHLFPARKNLRRGLKFDKKFERGAIRFVVCSQIGSAYLSSNVTMEDIREAVEQL